MDDVIFKVNYIRLVVDYSIISGDDKIMAHARIVAVNHKVFDHFATAVDPAELSLGFLKVLSESLQLISHYFGMSSEGELPLSREVFLA